MSKLINGRTVEIIKIGLINLLNNCGDIRGESTRCLQELCPYYGDDCCEESILSGVIALIEHLEAKQPKWISVKEQEPVFPCLYWDGVNTPAVAKSLVAITLKDGKEVFVADVLLEVFPEALQGLLEDCTHILYWMPLPEPPKEENV